MKKRLGNINLTLAATVPRVHLIRLDLTTVRCHALITTMMTVNATALLQFGMGDVEAT
jgi:hypothetical protein